MKSADRKIESESADRDRGSASPTESLDVGVVRLDRLRLDRSLEVCENLQGKRRDQVKRECVPSVEVSAARVYRYTCFSYAIPSPRASYHDLSPVESSSAHDVVYQEDFARTAIS